jgi:hypothetical protein
MKKLIAMTDNKKIETIREGDDFFLTYFSRNDGECPVSVTDGYIYNSDAAHIVTINGDAAHGINAELMFCSDAMNFDSESFVLSSDEAEYYKVIIFELSDSLTAYAMIGEATVMYYKKIKGDTAFICRNIEICKGSFIDQVINRFYNTK